MYHDQESQSSSSCEELTFVDRIENIGDDNNAPHTKISQRNFSQQLPPQPPLSPLQQQQQQHNGTNGRQPHRPVDKLNRNQQTNFAQWMTDIDKRVHLCLGTRFIQIAGMFPVIKLIRNIFFFFLCFCRKPKCAAQKYNSRIDGLFYKQTNQGLQ